MYLKSLREIEKVATSIENVEHISEFMPSVQEVQKALAMSAGFIGAAGGTALAGMLVNKIRHKLDTSKIKSGILEIEKELHNEYGSSDIQKAKARLFEIARVAPHITQNKDLVKSIISSKLERGLNSDDKHGLALLQSQYYKDPNVSDFMPKMASEEIGETLADIVMIKEAAFGKEELKTLALFSALPVTAGITGGLVNMALEKIKQKSLKSGLEGSFTQALSLSDHDKEPLLQNKEKAREAFGTLARFAPQVALDPQAARAFMNKIVSYDQGIDIGTVKELSEISKNLSTSKGPNAFSEGFAATSKLTGANNIISEGFGGASVNIAKGKK